MTWSFVTGALLTAAGVGVGWSQDRPAFTGRQPSAFMPTTASKPKGAPTRAPRKSYYAELFGESGLPQGEAATSPVQSQPHAPPAPEEFAASPSAPQNSGSFNFSPTVQAAPPADDGGIIYAEFERHPLEEGGSEIQQVGGQRIVRPARRAQNNDSPLTNPIAIPVQAESADVEPLFDAPPAPPQDAAAFAAPMPTAPLRRAVAPTPPETFAPQTDAAPAAPRVASAPAAAAVSAAPVASAPNIRVAWNKHGEVSIGRECRCELLLENTGAAAAQNLEVIALISPNARLLKSEPAPSRNETSLVWEISELPAGGSQTIQLTLLPLGSGEINTQAEVRYSTAVSESFRVAEPKLQLRLSGPAQTLLGESATQTILISNPGSGVAGNVQVAAVIPNGLEHARGGELLMDIGALHPGETRSVRLPLAAVTSGRHVVQVEARADGGLIQQASCSISVITPQMSAAIDGPSLRYLGRRAAYTVHVTNDGTVASDNVRVMHKVPEGFKFISADNGGQFDESTQLLNWFVGHLEPGQTLNLAATFECKEIGDFTHFVRSTDDQGAVSDAHVSTTVQGTPRLSMSVRDIDDPVETGVETAYDIELKNEGSAPARQVQLTCELPEALTLVNVTGAMSHRQAAGVLAFSPLAQLNPGETATVRIHVRSSVAGNLRIRAQLSSASIDEPLIQEEVTKFYGE